MVKTRPAEPKKVWRTALASELLPDTLGSTHAVGSWDCAFMLVNIWRRHDQTAVYLHRCMTLREFVRQDL